jgi:hypothetical protein
MLLFLSQYVLIYIPTSFILHYSSNPEFDNVTALELQAFMLIGLSIMQLVYYIPLAKVHPNPIKGSTFTAALVILILVPLVYLVVQLGGSFRLTAFGVENWDFRSQQHALGSQGALSFIGAYGEMWIAYILFPLLAAIGLFRKKRSIVIGVVVGYLFLYGLTAFRSQVLAPVFIFVIYFWTRTEHKYRWLFGTLSAALLWPLAILNERFLLLRMFWVALWHVRTICAQGLEFGQYFEFFRVNPTTHFMHLHIFSVLGMSPPNSDVMSAVSILFYGQPLGENANFWANDGICSLGIIGIPVMSVLCGALFYLLDCLAVRFKLNFVLVWFAFLPISFANCSLFTDLLTGGFGFLILLLYFAPKEGVMGGFSRVDS